MHAVLSGIWIAAFAGKKGHKGRSTRVVVGARGENGHEGTIRIVVGFRVLG